MANFEQWEYMTKFCYAHIDNQGAKEYLKQAFPDWKNPPKFTPQTMMPDLNTSGKKGWELVHMEPVARVENDGSVLFTTGVTSNVYFCVFKRRIRTAT